MISDRVPPQEIETEMSILGTLLYDSSDYEKIEDLISSNMFYKTAHRKIYSAIAHIVLKKGTDAVDIITIAQELKARHELDVIGGAYYLTELTEKSVSGANIEYHAEIIMVAYYRRALIQGAENIARDSHDPSVPLDSITERASKMSLVNIGGVGQDMELADILDKVLRDYDKIRELGDPITGVDTTLDKLNNITAGFQPQELIVLAGRPSHGKTAFAVQVAADQAIRHEKTVGFFSLEMSAQQIGHRIIAQEARVDLFKIRYGRLDGIERERVGKIIDKIRSAKIIVDPNPEANLAYIKQRASRLKKKFRDNLSLIVIDYLGLVPLPGKRNETIELGEVTARLKGLAKRLDIPIMLLAQCNRDMEREKRLPRSSDLRDSGKIEQDADVILFPFRPNFNDKDATADETAEAKMVLTKQRNGPIGVRNVTFLDKYALFVNPVSEQEEGYVDYKSKQAGE